MKKLYLVLFIIASSLIGLMLACGAPTQLATLNLKEAAINDYFKQSPQQLVEGSDLFTLDSVDIQEEMIRLTGTFQSKDQAQSQGTIDFKLSAVDGKLQADVITAEFGNTEFNDSEITQLERRIESILSRSISQGKQGVQFESVEMLDDLLKIQVRFLPPETN